MIFNCWSRPLPAQVWIGLWTRDFIFLIFIYLSCCNIYSSFRDNDWDFMPARVWIGLWTSGFILLIVIFNLSSLVKYITRFTEESFATLIAVIFIVEAFKKMFSIEEEAPVNFDPDSPISTNCTCLPPPCDFYMNDTSINTTSTVMTTVSTAATTGMLITDLGDNCIQNFHSGMYIVEYTVGNLVLRPRTSGAIKREFRTYVRQYSSPN